MNYLGHLLLTYPDPELTMGNLLGDMVRGREMQELPQGMQQGITVHRFIDRFTDGHAGIRTLVELLRTRHGKYATVAVDILLDHVLALQWEEHADVAFPVFTSWVYEEMVPRQIGHVHAHISERLQSMVRHRWLDGYPHVQGMHHVLARMDHRAAFPSQFAEAMEDFGKHSARFGEVFREFYRQLRKEVGAQSLARVTGMDRPAS